MKQAKILSNLITHNCSEKEKTTPGDNMKKIAIVANYNSESETHKATNTSLENLIEEQDLKLSYEWIGCEELGSANLQEYSGFFIGTGGPTPCLKETLSTIKFARESQIPLLGTCGGFQNVILETAQNVLGIKDAAHQEANPEGSKLFITKLRCSLRGRDMQLRFEPNTLISSLYNAPDAIESYYCSYGVKAKVR